MGSLPDIIGGEEPTLYLYQSIAMGVLDIIDTNTVELSKPGVRLAMKEAALTSLGIRREAQQIKKQFLKHNFENIDDNVCDNAWYEEKEKENNYNFLSAGMITRNCVKSKQSSEDYKKYLIENNAPNINKIRSSLLRRSNKSSSIQNNFIKAEDKEKCFDRQFREKDIKDREDGLKCKFVSLMKESKTSDLYIVNTDQNLTETIKNTFEDHGCKVSVSPLGGNLVALYVLINKNIKIRKLNRLMEKGKKFGLDFFLTKTGMSMLILNKMTHLFDHV